MVPLLVRCQAPPTLRRSRCPRGAGGNWWGPGEHQHHGSGDGGVHPDLSACAKEYGLANHHGIRDTGRWKGTVLDDVSLLEITHEIGSRENRQGPPLFVGLRSWFPAINLLLGSMALPGP